ncbi:MAG: response regulator [Thermoguttaceae bacterium]
MPNGLELPRPGAAPACILVVDDEAPVRALLARTLNGAGYEVLTAADGQEAAEVLAAHAGRVSLVLLDAVMPGATGYDTYNWLCTHSPQTRVIFCSGYEPLTDCCARAGRDRPPRIDKPIDRETLLRVVREVLGETEACQPA